jgi:hypothetical protein
MMSEGYDIDTVEAPDFEEYLDRYSRGLNLGMDSAMDAADQIYDELDEAALFGSLVAHPDYHGVEELKRPTDLSVDFMTTEEEVARISEDYDVWAFDNCYFAEMPAYVNGEEEDFAVGLVPVDAEIFGSGELPPMRLGEQVLEEAGAFDPEKDSLPVTDAETNYALKARRYVDSLLSGDHVKINDLSDQASMHLANQRSDGEVLDHGETAEKIVDYTSAQFPPYEVLDEETRRNKWVKETQERIDPHIGTEDWRKIVKDWEGLEESIERLVLPKR